MRRDSGDSLKKRGGKKARRSLRNRLRKNARARERGFFLLLGSLLRLDALDARDARARGRGLAGSDRVDICRDARARGSRKRELFCRYLEGMLCQLSREGQEKQAPSLSGESLVLCLLYPLSTVPVDSRHKKPAQTHSCESRDLPPCSQSVSLREPELALVL